MKICCRCKLEKPDAEYYQSKGRPSGACKSCQSIKYMTNRDAVLKKQRDRRLSDEAFRIKANEYALQYRKENLDYFSNYRELHGVECSRRYYIKHSDKILERNKKYQKLRQQRDPEFRFKCSLRNAIKKMFKNFNITKTKSCTAYGIDLRKIFEKVGAKPSQGHVLDHIIPLTVFDFTNETHVKLSHHPDNLRWVTIEENLAKSDLIYWDLIKGNENLRNIATLLGIDETMDNKRASS